MRDVSEQDRARGLRVRHGEGGKGEERHMCLTHLHWVSPSLGRLTALVSPDVHGEHSL